MTRLAVCLKDQTSLDNDLQKTIISNSPLKVLFTRSVKNFVRRAYFSFFKKTLERKKFQREIKKFQRTSSKQKNAWRTKCFTLRVNKA